MPPEKQLTAEAVLTTISTLHQKNPDRREPYTAQEIADAMGRFHNDRFNKLLHELADSNIIQRKRAGAHGILWWIPEQNRHTILN